MEHIEIPPHVQRLREEHEQTEQRLHRLSAFIDSNPVFKTLALREQADLTYQEALMQALEQVLSRRLARALAEV